MNSSIGMQSNSPFVIVRDCEENSDIYNSDDEGGSSSEDEDLVKQIDKLKECSGSAYSFEKIDSHTKKAEQNSNYNGLGIPRVSKSHYQAASCSRKKKNTNFIDIKIQPDHNNDIYNSDGENDVSSLKIRPKNTKNLDKLLIDEFKKMQAQKRGGAIIVVDMDETLIDNNNNDLPIPQSTEFLDSLEKLFFKGCKILWTKGSAAHVEQNLHPDHRKKFDKIILGSHKHLRHQGKPITVIRKLSLPKAALAGPYIIIDDNDENLRSDQYDITIDVKKYYIHSVNEPLRVAYNKIITDLIKRVNDWYKSKEER